MTQEVQNVMREIRLEKVVLNMGLGKSGDAVEIAKKALGQITNEDSMKPKVEQSKQIETDMELYLIGPDKHDFYKNLQENRKKPTSITTIETNDMDSYFGTSKLQTNGIAQLL
mgnify:CR=1 FL=1